jgi:hypothetical protein
MHPHAPSSQIQLFARQPLGPIPTLFRILSLPLFLIVLSPLCPTQPYSLFSALPHLNLYSNLPFSSRHLPVMYGNGTLFEPLFKTLILIFLKPLAAFKASSTRA